MKESICSWKLNFSFSTEERKIFGFLDKYEKIFIIHYFQTAKNGLKLLIYYTVIFYEPKKKLERNPRLLHIYGASSGVLPNFFLWKLTNHVCMYSAFPAFRPLVSLQELVATIFWLEAKVTATLHMSM